jgi:hypothetical protein
MPLLRRLTRLFAVAALLAGSGLPAALLQTAAWARMALRHDSRPECSVCVKAQGLASHNRAGIAAAPSARAELSTARTAPEPLAPAVSPVFAAAAPFAAASAPSSAVPLPPPRALA